MAEMGWNLEHTQPMPLRGAVCPEAYGRGGARYANGSRDRQSS